MLLAELTRTGRAALVWSREHPFRHFHLWKEAFLPSLEEEKMGVGILSLNNMCHPNVTCVAHQKAPVLIGGFVSGGEAGQTFLCLLGLVDVFWDEGAWQNRPRWPVFPSTSQFSFLLLFSLGQASARGDRLGSHYLFSSILNFLASTHLSSLNICNTAEISSQLHCSVFPANTFLNNCALSPQDSLLRKDILLTF